MNIIKRVLLATFIVTIGIAAVFSYESNSLSHGLRIGMLSGVLFFILFYPFALFLSKKQNIDFKKLSPEQLLKGTKSRLTYLLIMEFSLLPHLAYVFSDSTSLDTLYTAQVVGTIQIYSLVGALLTVIVFVYSLIRTINLKPSKDDIKEVKRLLSDKKITSITQIENFRSKSKFIRSVHFLYVLLLGTFLTVILGVNIVTIIQRNSYSFGKDRTTLSIINSPEENQELNVTTNGNRFSFLKKASGYYEYTDNPKKQGSNSNYLTYFETEDDMYRYLSEDSKFDINKVKDDDSYFVYLKKTETPNQYGTGTVLLKKYTVENFWDGNDYEFHNIVNYVNRDVDKAQTDANYDSSSEVLSKYCAINLEPLEKGSGYLLYSGSRSIGTYVDYCKEIEQMKDFKIQIGQFMIYDIKR